jgi:lipopolysaccharide exporter
MRTISSSTTDLDVVSTESGAALQEDFLHVEEIKKRSLSGVFSYIFRTLLLNGLAIITQLLLSGLLNAQDYGIYGLVVTMSGFFNIISDIGLAASLIQKKEEPTHDELRTVFTVQQGLTWLVFFLIMGVSLVLHRFGKLSQEGVYLAVAFGVSFPIVSLKTISSLLLERKLEFNKLIIPNIAETVVSSIVLIYCAMHGYGIRSFTYSVLVKTVVGVVIMWLMKPWDIGIGFSKKAFVQLMKVGTRFQLNDMLAKTKDDLFYLTVALFMPAASFGYITWAKLWSRLPYTLTVDNVTAVTFPAFSRLQDEPTLLRRAIEKTIFFVTFVAFPLFAGLVVMIYPFIQVYPKYMQWQPAFVSLALFSFGLAFSSFSTPLVNTLNAIGKVNQTLKMMLFWTSAQWVLFPFLYVKYGFVSVPLISAILGLTSLLVVILVKRHIVFDFFEQVWRQTLAALTMVVILMSMRHIWETSLLHLLAGVAFGGVVYLGLMLLTGFEKIMIETRSLLKK